LTRSTRRLAWLELAQMISMFSSANARPTCRHTEPPLASALFTRRTGACPSKRLRAAVGFKITLQCFEVGGPCSRWARSAAASVGSSGHRSSQQRAGPRLFQVNPRARPPVNRSSAEKEEKSNPKYGQHLNHSSVEWPRPCRAGQTECVNRSTRQLGPAR
jgi:hypothetical protein